MLGGNMKPSSYFKMISFKVFINQEIVIEIFEHYEYNSFLLPFATEDLNRRK
jgi:hypothetical protein